LSDLAGERVEEWKEAIGDIAWRDREEPHLVCLNTARAERPDVFDAEHDALARDCNLIWFAYQLARLRHPDYGECVIAKGHARESEAGVSLGMMQGWSQLHRLIRPNYCGDRQYIEVWRQDPNWLIDPDWPERVADCWRLLDGAHDPARELPPLVDRALDAYSVALRMNGVDHRLPYFVRSAESVLAIPRGQGRATFVARALRFLPTINSDLYIGHANIAEYLGDIYQLRSDCVHGKDPASGSVRRERRRRTGVTFPGKGCVGQSFFVGRYPFPSSTKLWRRPTTDPIAAGLRSTRSRAGDRAKEVRYCRGDNADTLRLRVYSGDNASTLLTPLGEDTTATGGDRWIPLSR
jgi:hypothetical protein